MPTSRYNFALAAVLKDRPSTDAMRQDIEVLRKDAMERFEKLSVQMEKLKEERQYPTKNAMEASNLIHTTAAVDILEGELSRQHRDLLEVEDTIKRNADIVPNVLSNANGSQYETNSLDLLDDTRWRIVFNIGREAGSWMPLPWGVSGDRLLFQVELDFTSEPLYIQDDFFQSPSGTKKLDVINAFLIPRGVGSQSVGRRPVTCKPSGGYKVCRGQGPMGTDLVRLFIELTEDLSLPDHESDISCPKGRVYATCGYFVMHDSRESGTQKLQSSKELAQHELREAVLNLDSVQFLLDSDNQLFSVQRLKKMKDVFDAKKLVENASNKLALIRQKEPEKSMLRLSKKGDVGLTKEGGVCCKVQKGMTMEYHILGRMEVGCLDDHKPVGSKKSEELIN